MIFRVHISIVLLLGAAFSSPRASAGSLRIALLDSAEVRGDAIFLADLLPKDAPRFVREAAEKISLGPAPQNGVSRRLSSSVVLAAVMAHGLQASEFQIPDTIHIHRASRLVTRAEVLGAIRAALAKNKGIALPDLQAEDLSFGSVLLPDQASPLEVTEISFDEFIGRARFRLWSASAPTIHPFYVTARVPFSPGGGRFFPIPASAGDSTALSRACQVAPAVLIEAGRIALLHLHSSNSSLFLEVKSLQRGRVGEVIRVRLPANGKTFRARVLEGGGLDARF